MSAPITGFNHQMMFRKAFVLLSGGLDSTTCLHIALSQADSVEAVSVNYGQRHKKEMDYAKATCTRLGIEHTVLDVGSLLRGDTVMLTNDSRGHVEVPNISYSDIKGVSPTYVPFRNGLMLSALTAHAQKWVNQEIQTLADHYVSLGHEKSASKQQATFEMRDGVGVYFGAHADDSAGFAYPDCTPEFTGAMANAIYIGSYFTIKLFVPLQYMNKADIVEKGLKLGVDFANTWSCLAKGTEVITLSGNEPIESIKAGRWVWGFDNNEMRWVPSLVEASFFQGIKEVYEIELNDGNGSYKSKFKATGDHRLMRREGGYIRVDKLVIGTRLMPANVDISYVTKKGSDGPCYHMIKPHNLWDEPHVYMHRYVADYFGMNMNGVIHHGEKGTLDNDPSNLTPMSLGEHTKHHIEEARHLIWNDEVNSRRANTVKLQWAVMSFEEREQRKANIRKGLADKKEQNHVVLSVKKVGEERTYDLQTSTENFAIGAGIFVHNCYKGEEHHCGVCPTCRSRREAFLLAGVSDPTKYAAPLAAE